MKKLLDIDTECEYRFTTDQELEYHYNRIDQIQSALFKEVERVSIDNIKCDVVKEDIFLTMGFVKDYIRDQFYKFKDKEKIKDFVKKQDFLIIEHKKCASCCSSIGYLIDMGNVFYRAICECYKAKIKPIDFEKFYKFIIEKGGIDFLKKYGFEKYGF